jgi:dihydrofolate reductase
MRKIKISLHTSLDGFVAGPEGEMDWIKVNDEIFDMAKILTDNSDSYLMGRKTFDLMNGYWPTAGQQPNASKHDKEHSEWYNQVPKVVLSRTLRGKSLPNTTIISDNVKENIIQLKKAEGKDIIIFGSPSAAHSLMQYDLIDTYILFVNPVLLGKGIPMFNKINNKLNLRLTDSNTFLSGVNFMQYDRV